MIHTLLVAGTRPNFIKIGPLYHAFAKHDGLETTLVHTGQHYDAAMSDVFFEQLELPEPDIFLSSGSGTHATQTARVMMELEPVIIEQRPDVVVVVGDVNSTFAAALTAKKLHVPVAHVEAGLRSFDRRMPEEINRVATDAISDFLFTTEAAAEVHLKNEGKSEDIIFFCGNVMIDSLRRFQHKARAVRQHDVYDLRAKSYVLLTAHRPEMVDHPEKLEQFVRGVAQISNDHPLVFPIHPRTFSRIKDSGLWDLLDGNQNVHLIEPLGYLEFLSLMMNAGLVLTDSGGVQEETTVLGVPCATIRDNTERPCTIDVGTNELIPLETDAIKDAAERALSGKWKEGSLPELWDGHAAERIAAILADELSVPAS